MISAFDWQLKGQRSQVPRGQCTARSTVTSPAESSSQTGRKTGKEIAKRTRERERGVEQRGYREGARFEVGGRSRARRPACSRPVSCGKPRGRAVTSEPSTRPAYIHTHLDLDLRPRPPTSPSPTSSAASPALYRVHTHTPV